MKHRVKRPYKQTNRLTPATLMFDLKSSKTSFPSYNCVLETIIMKTDLKISNEEPEPCDHYGVELFYDTKTMIMKMITTMLIMIEIVNDNDDDDDNIDSNNSSNSDDNGDDDNNYDNNTYIMNK